jgi:hypothetical protein
MQLKFLPATERSGDGNGKKPPGSLIKARAAPDLMPSNSCNKLLKVILNSVRLASEWRLNDLIMSGGPSRNRTGVQGFAVLCVTTPPSGLKVRMSGALAGGSRAGGRTGANAPQPLKVFDERRFSTNDSQPAWRGPGMSIHRTCITTVLLAYNT